MRRSSRINHKVDDIARPSARAISPFVLTKTARGRSAKPLLSSSTSSSGPPPGPSAAAVAKGKGPLKALAVPGRSRVTVSKANVPALSSFKFTQPAMTLCPLKTSHPIILRQPKSQKSTTSMMPPRRFAAYASPIIPPPTFQFRRPLQAETQPSLLLPPFPFPPPPAYPAYTTALSPEPVTSAAAGGEGGLSSLYPSSSFTMRQGRTRKPSEKKLAAQKAQEEGEDEKEDEEEDEADNGDGKKIVLGIGECGDVDYYPSFLEMRGEEELEGASGVSRKKGKEEDEEEEDENGPAADLHIYARDLNRLLHTSSSLSSSSSSSSSPSSFSSFSTSISSSMHFASFSHPTHLPFLLPGQPLRDWKKSTLKSLADAINLHPSGCLVNHVVVSSVVGGRREERGKEAVGMLDPSSSLYLLTVRERGGERKRVKSGRSGEGGGGGGDGGRLNVELMIGKEGGKKEKKEECSILRLCLRPGSLLRVGLRTAGRLTRRTFQQVEAESKHKPLQQQEVVVCCFRAVTHFLDTCTGSPVAPFTAAASTVTATVTATAAALGVEAKSGSTAAAAAAAAAAPPRKRKTPAAAAAAAATAALAAPMEKGEGMDAKSRERKNTVAAAVVATDTAIAAAVGKTQKKRGGEMGELKKKEKVVKTQKKEVDSSQRKLKALVRGKAAVTMAIVGRKGERGGRGKGAGALDEEREEKVEETARREEKEGEPTGQQQQQQQVLKVEKGGREEGVRTRGLRAVSNVQAKIKTGEGEDEDEESGEEGGENGKKRQRSSRERNIRGRV